MTEYVATPLPESCAEAVTLMDEVTTASGVQTSAAGKILLALQELNRVSYTRDFRAVNHTVEVLRKEKDRLDTSVVATTDMYLRLEGLIEDCEADTGND